MPIIKVEKLLKQYKLKHREQGVINTLKNFFVPKYYYKTAVNEISFEIEAGECVGYIGENGAGKSTTIKMLTGILYPTSGTVLVDGLIPYRDSMKNNMHIGTVFGQRSQLWWDLPVIDSFKLNKAIYEIPDNVYNENMKRYINLLNIDELLNIPVRNLSLGQRMKCEIAIAFLHNPKVVYLDEPTIGLDVLVKDDIRNFINQVNKEKNTTVILTTHDLKDIQEVCDRIIVIDKGTILYDGKLLEFIDIFGKHRLIDFEITDTCDLRALFNENYIEVNTLENGVVRVSFDKKKIDANTIIQRVSNNCHIKDLSIIEPDLEDIVKRIYRRNEDENIK